MTMFPTHQASAETQGKNQKNGATPMIAQYLRIKENHQDYLLFYRMGDFYEMFFDDAIEAAAALDITLTHRGRHGGQNIPMCGVPVSAVDGYLERLIRKGFKIAICEQTDKATDTPAPRASKSLMARDVVRLVTPGTLTEENLLAPRAHNYLFALAEVSEVMAAAWLDMSTGDVHVNTICEADVKSEMRQIQVNTKLAQVAPGEILLSHNLHGVADGLKESLPGAAISLLEAEHCGSQYGAEMLAKTYASPPVLSRAQMAACGALLGYVARTQIDNMPQLKLPLCEDAHHLMAIDAPTRTNLELMQTLSGSRTGSLLSVIDMTLTSAGGRLLAGRLASPLCDKAVIMQRQDALSYFYQNPDICDYMRSQLKLLPEMPRAISRLGLNRGGPRDLLAISRAISQALAINAYIAAFDDWPAELALLKARFDSELSALSNHLEEMLADELPLLARDGGFVREGLDGGLDNARKMRNDSRQVIAAQQTQYARELGIKPLKIKYNAVLNYYIEVPSAHGDKLMSPPHNARFIHRQTLTNVARFSTEELSRLASDISLAAARATAIEVALFETACARVASVSGALWALSEVLSALDVATSLAHLARLHDWCAPRFFDDMRFLIKGGRHAVVEAALRKQSAHEETTRFIANDCALVADIIPEVKAARLSLITGPNMAGKSTFLRQNALIAILAQMGSYVPAVSAEIGVIDRVFSRVGAADDLARGRSTFMVEMVETASILNQASERSLVILDEIGRGTATFDGLSLAWAVAEYLHDEVKCRALFATHYHELTTLKNTLDGLVNYTMRVEEYDGSLVFLHEVISGSADRSYGIHVAALAGLPASVLARAKLILGQLEESRDTSVFTELPLFGTDEDGDTSTLEPPASPPDAIRQALAEIDPDALSPREAHEHLYRLCALLKE